MQILFKVFWFPVLNSDKCPNHKFYAFLLFYCLILLRLLDTFPALLPRPILCISPPCCVHLLCVSLACSRPAVYIHYFSPPLLHACLPSIRLPLPLRVLPASPPPPVRASILHLALLLLGTWAFFRQLLQAFMHTLLCLLVFPHALSTFFQPPFAYPLSLLIFILFFLPSFWYSGSFSLLICATLLSVSPLYHFSPILSDPFLQIDSTGKMFCSRLQRCASLRCKPFSTVSNLTVVSLICRIPFFLILLHYWVHFHEKQSS